MKLLWDHRPGDGVNKHLWNAGELLPDYTALQPRGQSSYMCKFVNKCNDTQLHSFITSDRRIMNDELGRMWKETVPMCLRYYTVNFLE
jgi:hypothetical protein